MTRRSRLFLPVLAAVWLAGAAYGWLWLDRGWVPHDEGALAQSAERVAAGELPHADFEEIYTGGLSWAHAAAFELFGPRLIALRWTVFAVFLAWIPATYWIAARFAPPWLAGLVTAAAVALGLPNYAAAVPSWYALFLSTFALAAALRFVDTERCRWLAAAGALAGLAILVKVVGLYLLGALVVWLAFVEQADSEAAEGGPAGRAYSALLALAAVGVVAAAALVVRGDSGLSQALHFVLPAAAIAMLLVHLEWRVPRAPFAGRARRLAGLAGPLLAGAAVPLTLFMVPYAMSGELETLARGVFVEPRRRFEFATFAPPSLRTAVWALPPALALAWAARWPAGARGRSAALLAALLAAALLASGEGQVYRAVWASMRWSLPAVVVAGAVVLGRPSGAPAGARAPAGEGRDRRGPLLLLTAGALLGLIQFPFASPVYFLYVAPLALLAATALAARAPALRPAFALLVGFYLVFAVVRVTPGYIYAMGHVYRADDQNVPLPLARAGIDVSAADAATYARLVELVEVHGGDGALWAGPDAPEVYFLAGRDNPTRVLFDFTGRDPAGPAETLDRLERAGVSVVVQNGDPSFSPPVPPATARAIARRYPGVERVGRFEVRWRP